MPVLNQNFAFTISNLNDAPIGVPTITGTSTEDETLTAVTSAILDDDGLGTFSFQWQRGGVNITDATNNTYVLTDADVGAAIRVVVSYIDGQGQAETVLSADTALIANVNDAPAGSPIITGTPRQNETLGTDASSISDNNFIGSIIK